jgi:hypothetical protein
MAAEGPFPVCVTPDHIMGLMYRLSASGGAVPPGSLPRTAAGLNILPHVIMAAHLLGLVEVGPGSMALTAAGLSLAEEGAGEALAEALAGLEPFRTVLRALRTKGSLRREEALGMLGEIGYADPWQALGCLLHWLLYVRLVDYDPNEGVLRPLAF